ncbi:chemotaxis protein CheB [Paracoccus sediminilitoris]|uniref:chemotaxis protein CheB n=1 Tax=Paracoccus sediminilitoris TaxID=2202419 RepID=UPI00272D670A|nr:chemotaxis protein CheB [Paracoccus sediminilitoris]
MIAVGASSAEGLRNLCELLGEWPELEATVLIVLHRPWDAVTHLREILQRHSRMPVCIADQGQDLRSGCVYIGEPAKHLTMISSLHGALTFDPMQLHRNRTVDLLFHSLAKYGAPHIIGIVLQGSLDDGARGLAAIHDAGGCTMVITPAGFPDGMPNNAIGYDGPIDVIGSIKTIARAVEAAIDHKRSARS